MREGGSEIDDLKFNFMEISPVFELVIAQWRCFRCSVYWLTKVFSN